jgi:hypothetical protein
MSTLTTRYSHGDITWHRHVHLEGEVITCPLCGGTSRVHIAQSDREADCPECGYGSGHRAGLGRITTGRAVHIATIEERTIGQIRVEWTEGQDPEISYMAWESGVGSGSLIPEKDLYPTREEAEAIPLPAPVEPPKKGRGGAHR